MNTLGGVSLEVVVRQPPRSTLAEQQLNRSFTGKENKQDPLGKNNARLLLPLQKGNNNL